MIRFVQLFLLVALTGVTASAQEPEYKEKPLSWHRDQWKLLKPGISQGKLTQSLSGHYQAVPDAWDHRAIYRKLTLHSRCGNYYIRARFFPANAPKDRETFLKTQFTPDQLELTHAEAGVRLPANIDGNLGYSLHEVHRISWYDEQGAKWIRGEPVPTENDGGADIRKYRLHGDTIDQIARSAWTAPHLLDDMKQNGSEFSDDFKILHLIKSTGTFIVQGTEGDFKGVEKYLKKDGEQGAGGKRE